MTEEPFSALLDWLAPDRRAANTNYQSLRERLVLLFSFWGSRSAEEGADETFTRVAVRLDGGELVRTESRMAYLRGVARFVFLEELRRRERDLAVHRQLSSAEEREQEELGADERATCLQTCLSRLDGQTRELLLTYYQGQERERIERRQQLADRLGIALPPLRNRVERLRRKLRDCVDRCLGDASGDTNPPAATLVSLRAQRS